MLKDLFKPRERMSKALRDELHSLCHRQQMEVLGLPRNLERDIGLDCGCDQPRSSILPIQL